MDLRDEWRESVEGPTQQAGLPTPKLIVLRSPYRRILLPILDYVLEAERKTPDRQIAVILPELIQSRWYHFLLHNKRAAVLRTFLLVKGNARTVVINVPWYLKS